MRDGDELDTACDPLRRCLPISAAALVLLSVAATLGGCGLAETAVTGAAGAAAEAQAAKSAHAQLEATTQAIEQAQKTADEQRDRALQEAGQ